MYHHLVGRFLVVARLSLCLGWLSSLSAQTSCCHVQSWIWAGPKTRTRRSKISVEAEPSHVLEVARWGSEVQAGFGTTGVLKLSGFREHGFWTPRFRLIIILLTIWCRGIFMFVCNTLWFLNTIPWYDGVKTPNCSVTTQDRVQRNQVGNRLHRHIS